MNQLILPLALPAATRLQDYVAGDNQVLIDALHQQRTSQTQPLVYLSGEPGTGRTHLLMAQCNAAETDSLDAVYLPGNQLIGMQPSVLDGLEQTDLLAIDDVDQFAGNTLWEQALFNLFNRAWEAQCRLLISAQQAPAHTGFHLADLTSRFGWGLVYRMKPLDDAGREHLLIHLAAQRGLRMSLDIARYLVQREPRNTAHLVDLVSRLDQASWQEKRRLTLPFVRRYSAGAKS